MEKEEGIGPAIAEEEIEESTTHQQEMKQKSPQHTDGGIWTWYVG